MIAIALNNAQDMCGLAQWLLDKNNSTTTKHRDFLVGVAMLGEVLKNNKAAALEIYIKHSKDITPISTNKDLTLRLH